MSWRRLGVLLRQLPEESATKTEIRGFVHWSWTDHLLAAIADRLQSGNWQRGGGKGSRPKPIARPGDNQAKRIGSVSLTPAEFEFRLAEARLRGESDEVEEVI